MEDLSDSSEEKKYRYYAQFYDKNGSSIEMRMYCTRKELMDRAIELGYEVPNWYQFWKREIVIYAYGE